MDAFRTHDIVALSDPHSNVQMQAFLLSLIRDGRFPPVVNDIVIEAASARYQDAIDRFVRGDEVPYDVVRRAWEDHTAREQHRCAGSLPSLDVPFTLENDVKPPPP